MLEKFVNWAAGKRQPAPQATPPPLETLLAIVVPRKILVSTDYKEGHAVREPYGSFFDTCALDIGSSIEKAHGEFFDFRREKDKEGVSYVFHRGDLTVTYKMTGTDRMSSSSGENWSNDVQAQLSIKAPEIDLRQASSFLLHALETNLLDYREWTATKFGIFYKDQAGNTTEGKELLSGLDIHPTEAAEWKSIMYFAFYTHRIFEAHGPKFGAGPLDYPLADAVSMRRRDN